MPQLSPHPCSSTQCTNAASCSQRTKYGATCHRTSLLCPWYKESCSTLALRSRKGISNVRAASRMTYSDSPVRTVLNNTAAISEAILLIHVPKPVLFCVFSYIAEPSQRDGMSSLVRPRRKVSQTGPRSPRLPPEAIPCRHPQ